MRIDKPRHQGAAGQIDGLCLRHFDRPVGNLLDAVAFDEDMVSLAAHLAGAVKQGPVGEDSPRHLYFSPCRRGRLTLCISTSCAQSTIDRVIGLALLARFAYRAKAKALPGGFDSPLRSDQFASYGEKSSPVIVLPQAILIIRSATRCPKNGTNNPVRNRPIRTGRRRPAP